MLLQDILLDETKRFQQACAPLPKFRLLVPPAAQTAQFAAINVKQAAVVYLDKCIAKRGVN